MWTCQKTCQNITQHQGLLQSLEDDGGQTRHYENEGKVTDEFWQFRHLKMDDWTFMERASFDRQ